VRFQLLLNDVDDFIANKTFDIEGNSKITPVKSALDGVSVPLALISFYIANFIRILNLLDVAIEKCQSEVTSTPYIFNPRIRRVNRNIRNSKSS
jgi:hypothetical protein